MKKNYNYAFLFYDVGEKRVNKVFKVCKKYLNHYQNSVFRGSITPSNLINLRNELKKVAKQDYDFISIVKMVRVNDFNEEVIGKKVPTSEDIFL